MASTLYGSKFGSIFKTEVAAISGGSTVVPPTTNWLVLTQTGTISSQTINLIDPALDGDILTISTNGAITALTFSPTVTGWTNGSALAAGSGFSIGYSHAQAAWLVENGNSGSSSGYTLPAATATTLGGVIVPSAQNLLLIDGSGNLTHNESPTFTGTVTTSSGNLTLGTNTLASGPTLTLNSAAGQERALVFATAGNNRWV